MCKNKANSCTTEIKNLNSMATIKAVVSHHKKEDGTYNVRIRITHHKQTKMLPTTHFVTESQFTRNTRKIKDVRLAEILNNTIATYQHIIDTLGWRAEEMNCQQIVDYIHRERAKARPFTLPMAGYMVRVSEGKRDKTATSYRSAAASILRYTGGADIDIKDITVKWLEGYRQYLEGEPCSYGNGRGKVMRTERAKKTSTVKRYIECLRSAHNQAKREFNDEDRGVIHISGSPFIKFRYDPLIVVRKRSLTRDELLLMWRWDGESKSVRYARDVFFISFFLMGCNMVDLYSMRTPKDGVLMYNRQKTRGRRADEAYMEVRVEAELEELMRVYGGRGGYAFDFRQRYGSAPLASGAVNRGLESLSAELGLEPITFYWARHSWATIAYNDVGVDKYVVHEALCHIAQETKITDVYIRRSWDRIWECNRRVIDFVFG